MEVINAMREEVLVSCEIEEGAPHVLRPASSLAKRTIIDDNDREFTVVTEYRLHEDAERAVHRSAHVTLKKPAVFAESAAGSFA